MKLLQASYKLIVISLQASYKLIVISLQASYKLIVISLQASYSKTSYKHFISILQLVMNILSYSEHLTNFLGTSNIHLMKF
jgi:hypothetical protein